MYAIVDIAGQQFKVEKDQKLYVHRLEGEEGKKVSFDKVLLLDNGKNIAVGDPVVKGASVTAKILSHMKADKVLVFKKKRRKGYKKLNGHRQYMTQVQIEAISEKSASKPASSEQPAEKKVVATKAASATKKPAVTKAASATKKPAATKKTTAAKQPEQVKPEAKQTTSKKVKK